MKGEGIDNGQLRLRSASQLTWKFRAVFLCVWCVALVGLSPAQNASASSSKSSGSFTLNGTVVNSITGEPIGRALVRLSGVVQRTTFSDGEGHFQIDGLPAGSVDIGVQKPGYFSQQELNRSTINKLVTVGAETGPMVLKLTPQSAIYGRVTDAAGQPIEQVPVHLTERSVHDGRQRWDLRGFAQSDEDGRFRFANLMPGTYYLAAGPGSEGVRLLADDKKPKTGYPSLYYPGAPDLASASPIQLGVGQQAEADFSMTAVPQPVGRAGLTSNSSERGHRNVRHRRRAGRFVRIEGVLAGGKSGSSSGDAFECRFER